MAQLPPYLIVDDEDDDLFIMKRLMAKAGIGNKGVMFQEPLVALDYLRCEVQNGDPLMTPFLVFTDLHMPTIDGLEFTKRARAIPQLQSCMIVVVSSSEDAADGRRAINAGANRFLPKYPTALGVRALAQEAGADLVA
jgi:CheY-like chemotaxis protein